MVTISAPTFNRKFSNDISVINSHDGEIASLQLCYPEPIGGSLCPSVYVDNISDDGFIVKECSICRNDLCNKFNDTAASITDSEEVLI